MLIIYHHSSRFLFIFRCFYSLGDKDEMAAITAIATVITETTYELWRDVISLAWLSTGIERYERGAAQDENVHLPTQSWPPPLKCVLFMPTAVMTFGRVG